ncbi:dihydropteroate synthase [Leptospira ilyithenensis]|uniref:Dihydropteroate synthase n=1 Tax=Leptospira ilyithenensis TaxID=2484901 RepID=A0A4R9LUR1_9LEPT|nr:dihydropteroate synthase [Leptospira ilyithenensis]TGN11179.1 dihydropteroate synthase [Leptospira ilyithenensis]
MSQIFGILNITTDSFSDGGQFLDPGSAIKQGQKLRNDGADYLDISGQSSNVKSALVSEESEWERIEPTLRHFVSLGVPTSVDSFRPNVQAKALEAGTQILNDITGFTHPDAKPILRDVFLARSETKLIVMHSHTLGIAKEKSELTPENVVPTILNFFRDRKSELTSWGIAEERIYFDPGMGFFLGEDPELSFTVLRNIDQILSEFPRLMLGVSRKSFLGNVLGGLPPKEREMPTLTTEIYLLQKKVPLIRTHDVLKLTQAKKIWGMLER